MFYKLLLFLFLFMKLTFVTQGKTSYFLIENFRIESITQNQSVIPFCASVVNEKCVNSSKIEFNKHVMTFKDSTTETPFNTEIRGLTKIITEVNIWSNFTSSIENSEQEESLNFNIKRITLKIPSHEIAVTVNLVIQCQRGYMLPSCTEIDLCSRIPSNMCQNNGSCIQENDTIKCKCNSGFRGVLCDESPEPCQRNLCSNHSSCEPDNEKKLKYYCKCNEGYAGELCNDVINPCNGNFCGNNSTCFIDEREKFRYRCECMKGYEGRFCELEIDKCAQNQSLCSHFVNARCLSAKEGPLCYCDGGCKISEMTTVPSGYSLSFKWPFSELITFLFVVIEGVIIVLLILLIVIIKCSCSGSPRNRNKSYLDDNILRTNGDKNGKECLEFGSNYARKPIASEDFDNRQSINPLYDINDIQPFHQNHLVVDSPGMSTFGRR